MGDIPVSVLNRSVVSPVAGFPVSEPATLRSPNIRSVLVISIGSGPTPRSMETPPGRRPLKVAAIGLPPGSRYQNDLGAAERLQGHSRIGSGTIDVVVGAELLGEFCRAGATGNRRQLESHVPGVLHTQMTKAADAEHSDKIAR